MTDDTHAAHDDLREQLAELRRESQDPRDHRTTVRTLLTLAGGVGGTITWTAAPVLVIR